MHPALLESINPPSADEQRAAAFLAAPFHWKDLPLHALAIGRESAWLMHCFRIGLPQIHLCMDQPEAFLSHAHRLLWFCAVDHTEWLGRTPLKIEERIAAWSDKHILPGEQLAVIKLALQIYERAHLNRATPIPTEDDDADSDSPGEQPGLAPSRATPASSARPIPSSPKTTSCTSTRKSAAGPTSTPKASRTATTTNGPKKPPKKKRNSARGLGGGTLKRKHDCPRPITSFSSVASRGSLHAETG